MRRMLAAALCLALLPLGAQARIPPPLPPPADRLLAAMILWSHHPLYPQGAVETAVSDATTQALFLVGIRAGFDLAATKRYILQYDRLKPLIAAHLPTDLRKAERDVAECMMDRMLWSMTAAEIAEADRFLSTPTGQKYYAAWFPRERFDACYKQALAPDLQATDADYRAIGLTPPKPPPPRSPNALD